jgi:hypothetical protein
MELQEIHPDIVSGKTGYYKMAQAKKSQVPDLSRAALAAKHEVEKAKLEEKLNKTTVKRTTAKKVKRG